MKRKGESYLGGHTVITLHPRIVEAGLADQAREHKQQVWDEQQRLDALRGRESYDADLKDWQTHSPERRALQNMEKYHRDQLRQIERALHLKPHPRIAAQLLARELVLLEKLMDVVMRQHPDGGFNGAKRQIRQRTYHAQRQLDLQRRRER